MRELDCTEVCRLRECLEQLAEHHNEVSVNFRGSFPKRPAEDTLASFEQAVRSGKSRIAVIEDNGRVLGFCKTDTEGEEGKLDYLIVLKEYRGAGYGKVLMDRAMEVFRESGVRRIEIRVVDGNDAMGFYEKYGFRTVSHILRNDL